MLAVLSTSFCRHITCTRFKVDLDWGTLNNLFWKMHALLSVMGIFKSSVVVLRIE